MVDKGNWLIVRAKATHCQNLVLVYLIRKHALAPVKEVLRSIVANPSY